MLVSDARNEESTWFFTLYKGAECENKNTKGGEFVSMLQIIL